MKGDLRKVEVGGVSSRELYVKREFDLNTIGSHASHEFIQLINYLFPSQSIIAFSICSLYIITVHLSLSPILFMISLLYFNRLFSCCAAFCTSKSAR